MKSQQVFSRNKITLAISLAAASFSLYAAETRTVLGPQGTPVFQVNFFNPGDGPYGSGDTDASPPVVSTWTLNEDQKNKITIATNYWASILKLPAGMSVPIINVGTMDMANATAGSALINGVLPNVAVTQVQSQFLGKQVPVSALDYAAYGQANIGKMNYDTAPYTPSLQPRSGANDLTAVMRHEMGHALGIINNVEFKGPDKQTQPYFASTELTSWASHLRDDNGNPAQPGQAIVCGPCDNPASPAAFDVSKDKSYFTGTHVSEVLAGAMPGVPVTMFASPEEIDTDGMSHIELQRGLMSHQDYRNYTTFMEAELAVVQDLGYQLDRRNFFGYSVYGDGQTIYNSNGYFLRDPSGTQYIKGQYNTADLGMGLHVYGSDNLIYQQADLLTRGAGAAGVRIDGDNNTLVVNPGTRIYADGENGRGILVAYGSDHDLTVRGDVQAVGKGGVGIEFNFGNNVIGNATEYRGSYIHTVGGKDAELLPELDSAMVSNIDITGRVAGTAAALYMSANALVDSINIMNGAKIEGAIVSDYDQEDENGDQRLTNINFGFLANKQGQAQALGDPNFRMTYANSIVGINNLSLHMQGGETTLNGINQVYDVEVTKGATLSGTGTFTLNEEGEFLNSGTVSPGTASAPLGTITVNGDYRQTAGGRLLVDVDGKGGHDTLKVNGESNLNGRLTIAPQRGWYSPQWTMNTRNIVAATSNTGAFSQVDSTAFSPTLTLHTVRNKDNTYTLQFARAANAYSQYALSSNGSEVGQALSQSASQVRASDIDRQKLYTALDFSDLNGRTVGTALEQLSPSAYSAMIGSSLQREQQIADAISTREPGKLRDDEWQAFIQPFGGNTRQNSDNDTIGYTSNSSGVIFGAETAASSDNNLIVGLHGAASKQSVNLKDPLNGDGKTTAMELGVHARYAADPMAGSYMLGSARVGYETGDLKRKLNFGGYSAENKGDWNGKSASLVGGGGYRFKLNENVSMGPIATLTYTSLWRDGLHEKGADGSTLKLDSQQFDSLRSSIGLNSAMKFPLDSGKAIKAETQVTWNHELLDTNLTQDATFANYQGTSFKSKDTVMGRDSMGLRSSVRYQLSENLDIGAGVSSDLFRTGYNSVAGDLSLDWRF